jgi:putative transposase
VGRNTISLQKAQIRTGTSLRTPHAIRLLVSLVDWVFRRLLELVALRLRSERSKELEILVLRHQLHVLQRQVARPRLRPVDRLLLAALGRSLPRPAWSTLFVSPATVLRWHRELVPRRWTYSRRAVGRPRTDKGISEFVLRLARENPTWGYRRIHGELVSLGVALAPSTVWAILRRHGIEPAPRRAELSWSEVLRAQACSIIACDFLTVDTLWLRRLHVLFFIELATRRVHFVDVTANPNERWVTQQARNLVMTLADREEPVHLLVRDRDSKFTRSFDEVFRTEDIRVIRTPVRAPQAKAHAERGVGSLRRECLDRILIVGRRQLEQVVRTCISHHNEHRPHRSLEHRPPLAKPPPARAAAAEPGRSPRSHRRSDPRVPRDRRVNRRQRLLRARVDVASPIGDRTRWCSRRSRRFRLHQSESNLTASVRGPYVPLPNSARFGIRARA